MHGRRGAAVLSAAMILLLGGCGAQPSDANGVGGGAPATAAATAAPAGVRATPVQDSYALLADIEVRISGARVLSWSGREELQVARVGGPGIDVNLLSVGFMQPIETAEDSPDRFRWAFDLLNAYADEPGSFTIPATGQGGAGLRSLAFLIWVRAVGGAEEVLTDPDAVESIADFREIGQPCTVEVGAALRTGSLDCPQLAGGDHGTVALQVRWSGGQAP